jgi:methyl-accepting chemotaxis protein
VASAVAEMNSTAKVVSDHTDETKMATMKANEDAANGKNKARLANDKISELEEKIQSVGKEIENLHRLSQGIDNIIKMINEITLKTTLLSFNASVEAARAGIHGKGFSVVAQEIGQLANQTKGSTKDIALITEELKNKMELTSKLMSETVLKAREGKEFVGQSTQSLEAISNEVARVTEMAQSISVAAKEQSMASESVDRNLGVISNLTDQNVESARELNLVGEGLQTMASKLDELIKSFKI